MQAIHQVLDEGERVPILDCDLVQGPIIKAESKCSIFLVYEQGWSTIGGDTWLDESFLNELSQLLSKFFLLRIGEAVGGAKWWRLVGLKLNLVVDRSLR